MFLKSVCWRCNDTSKPSAIMRNNSRNYALNMHCDMRWRQLKNDRIVGFAYISMDKVRSLFGPPFTLDYYYYGCYYYYYHRHYHHYSTLPRHVAILCARQKCRQNRRTNNMLNYWIDYKSHIKISSRIVSTENKMRGIHCSDRYNR